MDIQGLQEHKKYLKRIEELQKYKAASSAMMSSTMTENLAMILLDVINYLEERELIGPVNPSLSPK